MLAYPNAEQIRKQLDGAGSSYLPHDASLFSEEEWAEIEKLVFHPELPWEKVTVGDADEPNDVHVGRFMTDVERPLIVNPWVSQKLLAILVSPQVMALFGEILGAETLCVRRAQVNRMESGSFIGFHLDRDSNPDYEISIVLQLGKQFSGGEFVVHENEAVLHSYAPSYRSILISRCDLPHEVKTVTAGDRISLVFFLSRHSGLNRRLYPEA
ncbi:2OG-Fe(II) oxygenase [Chromobacterium sp. IIBBL 290-4]|uniref:2OG-Fe(II) oxygenase n=1 Tax=Chromobacterium sp. IIBBL 290-4 TaxID=2953890 RepID=UPI0020B74E9A|nr:2OG-Fe(II) oxygenase [Chromobacterium sp. IIBBL 290-4]UTH73657.1 2OG-Fe(II) oxygenase [Chromobacterium sp. IIBBL 290-4]